MFIYTRFASLSVSSGSEASSSSPRLTHPLYGGGLSPAMSHTYINQYTGSEYNLDKLQVCNFGFCVIRMAMYTFSVIITYMNFFAVTVVIAAAASLFSGSSARLRLCCHAGWR